MNTQENNTNEIGLTKECPTLKEKRKKAIAYLGKNWLLHPDNAAQKKGN